MEEAPEELDGGPSNSDLYRDLKRYLPTAIFEDYYQQGNWKRQRLLVDLELVQGHRKIAGSPEPPPLDQAPEPSKSPKLPAPAPVASPTPSSAAPPAPRLTPKAPSMPPPRTVVDNAHQDELRRISSFLEKWNMEQRRGTEALKRLKGAQQLWVMREFRLVSKDVGPTLQLENFIRDAERDPSFPAPGALPPPERSGEPADRGLKRALSDPSRPLVQPRGSVGSPRPRLFSPPASPMMPVPRPTVAPMMLPRTGKASAMPPRPQFQESGAQRPGKADSKPGDLIKNLLI